MAITDYGERGVGQVGQLARVDVYEGSSKTTEHVNIAQVEEVTIGGTWAENDTVTVKMRGVAITSTAPATPSIEDVVDEMVADWNADEFAAAIATAVKNGTTKVDYTSAVPGQDCTSTVTKSSSSGTAVRSAVTANQAALDLPFGIGVAVDVNDKDNRVILPVDANSVFAGVTVKQDQFRNQGLAGLAGIPAGETFGVGTRCYIYVLPEEAVTRTDPVYWRHTKNSNGTPGGFRKDADSSTAVQLTRCHWEKGGDSTNPAVLYVEV